MFLCPLHIAFYLASFIIIIYEDCWWIFIFQRDLVKLFHFVNLICLLLMLQQRSIHMFSFISFVLSLLMFIVKSKWNNLLLLTKIFKTLRMNFKLFFSYFRHCIWERTNFAHAWDSSFQTYQRYSWWHGHSWCGGSFSQVSSRLQFCVNN